MNLNPFKKTEKKSEVIELTLQELISARDTIVRAGKENAEKVLSELTPELETFVEGRIQHMYNIQKDEETIKNAIAQSNITTSNNINIFKLSSTKIILQKRNELAKKHEKSNPEFLKRIKNDQERKILKREIDKLSSEMKKINEWFTVKIELVSGVINA